MKRGISIAIMIICGFVAYQSYVNSQPNPTMEAMSRDSACAGADGCTVKNERPNVLKTSIFNRQYQWATSGGNVVVTCKREYVWWGNWSCASAPGELAY